MQLQGGGAWPEFVSYNHGRGADFTCMATSGEGYVVVGSKDGKLRLYNSNLEMLEMVGG